MKPNLIERFFSRAISAEVTRRVKLLLTGADGFYERGGGQDDRDRFDYDREEILRQALEAWRVNPLARRIVELTSQYVVGSGLSLECKDERAHAFLTAWWRHPLNQMTMRVFELCDEITRSGELFIVISTDAAGMSYLRAIPAILIQEVHTAVNDLEQETAYVEKPADYPLHDPRTWPAYDERSDDPEESGAFRPVVLHYAVNRPAGAVRGESDLAPLLRWLTRYSAWLEDRARLNRFRQAFLYVVKSKFGSEGERLARQTALNAAPPSPGSILVTDEGETWEVISPKLEAGDANTDGLALKKMIASGAGVPLHFLAEPESSTRTTAESAGGPTFKHFEQRQVFFTWMMGDIIRVVLRRRARVDHSIDPEAEVAVHGADISGRDNTSLAIAASTIAEAFTQLRDRGLIDDAELMRITYRFAGEVADVEALLHKGRAAGVVANKNPGNAAGRPSPGKANPGFTRKIQKPKIDPETGDLKGVTA